MIVPAFMYGTAWKKEATTRLVELALETGFKAIDTANQLIHYQEALVGDALLAVQKRGIRREDLFLQTKFTPLNGQRGQAPYDPSADPATQVRQSFDSSLAHLHTDYLDSYVLHGPSSRWGLVDQDWEVWSALEALHRSGQARMIGVSNVSSEQLVQLCKRAATKPMIVQNRCYAVAGWDKEVRRICRDHGILYQGFSLLTANIDILGDPNFRAIASKHGATLPQIVFRFAIQIGMLPLTGTTDAQHMKEDLQAGQFTLTPEELARIESIAIRR